MNDPMTGILLFCVLYTLWIILPLVPAVLIYRIFPNTRTTAEGEVSNWKIKASGAFAAYLAIFVASSYLMQKAQIRVINPDLCVWTLSADVKLKDRNGRLAPPHLLSQVGVSMKPELISNHGQFVDILIPVRGNELPNYAVTIAVKGFGSEMLHLAHPSAERKIDFAKRKIQETVIIEQEDNPYTEKAYLPPSVL